MQLCHEHSLFLNNCVNKHSRYLADCNDASTHTVLFHWVVLSISIFFSMLIGRGSFYYLSITATKLIINIIHSLFYLFSSKWSPRTSTSTESDVKPPPWTPFLQRPIERAKHVWATLFGSAVSAIYTYRASGCHFTIRWWWDVGINVEMFVCATPPLIPGGMRLPAAYPVECYSVLSM